MELKRGEKIETLGLVKIQNKKAGRNRDHVSFSSICNSDFNNPLQVDKITRWGG